MKLSLWFIIGACTQQQSWEDRFWGSGAIIVKSYQCYAMKHRFVSQVPLVSPHCGPQQCHGWPVSGDLPLSALCTVYVRVMVR